MSFLSADADPCIQSRVRRGGGVSYLVKTCLPQTLVTVISAFVSKSGWSV